MKLYFVILALSLGFFTNASEEPQNVGGDKAVSAFDHEQGFKLSEKSLKFLNVQFSSFQGPPPWTMSERALVQIKDSVGVYRKRQGWILWVPVQVLKTENQNVSIQSKKLSPGDEWASFGAMYLRLTDADLNAAEAGHEH